MPEVNDSFERGKFEGQVLAVLSRIEQSIADLTAQKNDDHKGFDLRLDANETRIARLEQWRFWLLGAFAALALLFGLVKDYIIDSLFAV